jgi:hypothetical protein
VKSWLVRQIVRFFFYKQWYGQDLAPAFAMKGELEAILGLEIPALVVPKLVD